MEKRSACTAATGVVDGMNVRPYVGADYAEWLPRLHPDESIESGDVVGIFGGSVSKQT